MEPYRIEDEEKDKQENDAALERWEKLNKVRAMAIENARKSQTMEEVLSKTHGTPQNRALNNKQSNNNALAWDNAQAYGTNASANILKRIYEIGQTDSEKAKGLYEKYKVFQDDPTTPIYNPYAKASNQKALTNLGEILGEDLTGGVTAEWLDANRGLLGGARYTTTGEAPAAPTKSSTPQENAAYWYYQLLRDQDTTDKADAEWASLKKEISYLANSDKNYSPDEILERIDWSKYGTLKNMDNGKKNGVPVGLNRSIGYSEDALYGAIWAAWNGGGTGNAEADMVKYALGEGKGYRDDPEIRLRRTPGTKEYNPYVSGTIDDAKQYFGITGEIRPGWAAQNKALLGGSETDRKMYLKILDAEETAGKAKAELDELWAVVKDDVYTYGHSDPDEILAYLKADFEKSEKPPYATLAKMDRERQRGGALDLAYGVNYRWEDLRPEIEKMIKAKQEADAALAKISENALTQETVADTPNPPPTPRPVPAPAPNAPPKATSEETQGPSPTTTPTATATPTPTPTPTPGATVQPIAENEEMAAKQAMNGETSQPTVTGGQAETGMHATEKPASAAYGASGFEWGAFESHVATLGKEEAEAYANDFVGSVQDWLAGKAIHNDDAKAWAAKYGYLLGGMTEARAGGMSLPEDTRTQGGGTGKTAMTALKAMDSAAVSSEERVRAAFQISIDKEAADAAGVTLDQYYEQNPEAAARLDAFVGYADAAGKALEAQQARERDLRIDAGYGSIDAAYAAVATGTATAQQAAVVAAVDGRNAKGELAQSEAYKAIKAEMTGLIMQEPYGQVGQVFAGIMLLAEKPYEHDAKTASVLGISLDEFYKRYPSEQYTARDAVDRAVVEFDTAWSQFGRDIHGAEQVYMSLYEQAKAETQEAEQTPGAGVGLLRATGEGIKTGANQFVYGVADAVDMFFLQAEAAGVETWARTQFMRDEYRAAAAESIALIADDATRAYWEERLASIDDIYKLGYNLKSEEVQRFMARRQANMQSTRDFIMENGTELEQALYNTSAAVTSNALMMLESMGLTLATGNAFIGTTIAFGMPEGAGLARELYEERGKSLAAARAWGVGAAALTGASEMITNVNFMPEALAGTAPTVRKWITQSGAARLLGKHPQVAARLLTGAARVGISALEEGAQEGIQSLVAQQYESLARGEGLTIPNAKQAWSEAKQGALTAPFLYGLGSATGSAANKVSNGILHRMETQGGLLTAQDGAALESAIKQDAQNASMAAQNQALAEEAGAAAAFVEDVAGGALIELQASPEAMAYEDARAEAAAAEQAEAQTEGALQAGRELAEEMKQQGIAHADDAAYTRMYVGKASEVKVLEKEATAAKEKFKEKKATAKRAARAYEAKQQAEVAVLRNNARAETAMKIQEETRTVKLEQTGKALDAIERGMGDLDTQRTIRQAQSMRYSLKDGEAATGNEAAAARGMSAQRSGPVKNPIQTVERLARDLGIGAALGGKKLGEGKRLPKAVQGYYASRSRYIASRHATDYHTGMHEAGHALADKLKMTATQEMVDALDPVFAKSYKADELPGEAYAEFIDKYMTDPDKGASFAGEEYVRQFEATAKKEGLGKAIEEARESMQGYLLASTEERIGAMIVNRSDRNPQGLRLGELADRKRKDLTAATLDWTVHAGDVDKAVARETGKYPTGDKSLREMALFTNVSDKRAGNLLTNALTDSHGTIIGESLHDAFEKTGINGKDFDLFNDYLLAKHSIDRDAQGKPVFGSDLTAEQRIGFIERVETEKPEIRAAGDALHKWWNDFMQAWLVDTGHLSQEAFDTMQEMYPNYVPTLRQINGKAPRQGGKFSIKRASGSDLQIYSPTDSMVEMVNQVVRTVAQNNVGVVWHNTYESVEGLGEYGRRLTEVPSAKTLAQGEIEKLVKGLLEGKDVDGDFLPSLMDAIRLGMGGMQDQNLNEGSNTITVTLPDGTKAYYEIFEPGLYKMFAKGGEVTAKKGFEWLAKATRSLSALTTGNLPFAIRNAWRDLQQSVAHGSWASNLGTGLIKWIGAAGDVKRGAGKYKEYLAMGGGGWNRIGTHTRQAADAYRSQLFEGYDTSTKGRAIKKAISATGDIVTFARLNEIIENASRYAEFKYGKTETDTPGGRLGAFRNSQEATVDFGRHGTGQLVNDLGKIVPFLGPTLQGTYQAGRVFTEAERGRLAPRMTKIITTSALMAAISAAARNAFMSDEDKEAYKLLATDIQNKYIILPNIFGGDRRFMRLPVSQNPFTSFFYGVFTQAFEHGLNDEFTQELAEVAQGVFADMNPFTSTIFSPVLTTTTNKNWYGGLVVPQRLQGLPVTQQYDETTASLFIAAARYIDAILPDFIDNPVSPMHVEYFVQQHFGFYGGMGVTALSKNRYTGEIGGVNAMVNALRNQFTIDPATTNDYTDAFYKEKKNLDHVVAVSKANRELDMLRYNLTPEEAKQAEADAKALLNGPYGDAVDQISDLWDEFNEIQKNDDLTQAQKNILGRDIRDKQGEIMRNASVEYLAFQEKYILGNSAFGYATKGSQTGQTYTALELAPQVFQDDYENGAEYMTRAVDVWVETGENSALPHPRESFSKDKVTYVIPESHWGEWVDAYKRDYEKYMRNHARRWDEMTTEQKMEVLASAHSAAHEGAKGMWLGRYKNVGRVE